MLDNQVDAQPLIVPGQTIVVVYDWIDDGSAYHED
jgi:hypothetical protein